MRDNDQKLTEQERAELASLPRERDPRQLLEERTVQALRQQRLLGTRFRPTWYRRMPFVAAGIAAAAVLFLSGLAVGQWLGTRTVTDSMAAANHQTGMQAAAAVQRAGSAYVLALTALAQVADTTDDGAVEQGREVALASLYAAVRELVLLAPDDPMAVVLREELARLRPDASADVTPVTNLVWF